MASGSASTTTATTPPPLSLSCVLVTGANSVLGYECCKQLAGIEGVKKVILGCRDETKAQETKTQLRDETGKDNLFFDILLVDLTSLVSVRNAVEDLKEPIDGLVMNAGGMGGPKPDEILAETGVPRVVAINLMGHFVLVEKLIEEKKITSNGSVVFSGTEGARSCNVEPGEVEDFFDILDGSKFRGSTLYNYVKFMGALWMSSMARNVQQQQQQQEEKEEKDDNNDDSSNDNNNSNNNMRFVTMSPGGTYDAESFRESRFLMKKFVVPYAMRNMGLMHSSQDGAKRYIDALIDEEMYKSGLFYASKKGYAGEVVDQSEFCPSLSNTELQDNSIAAIRRFLR